MPELPEVETVRAGLAAHVVGRTIAAAQVFHPRAVRHHDGGGADLAARLAGRTITAAVRRGKYLWLELDADGEALLAHLGMSGQLLVSRPGGGHGEAQAVGAPPTMVRALPTGRDHLRVRVDLADGGSLSFVDQRTFGHVLLTDLVPTADGGPGGHGSEVAALPVPVAHIARDLLDPHLDRVATSRRLRTRRTEVKRALLDQTLVSGVGNIYADEALWRARLHPRRPTDRLRPPVVGELFDAAEAVMRDALAAGGTSFDALYVDVEGASGYFARSLDAYGRAGLPCGRCGTAMLRESFSNRSSTLCPRCQRPPRAAPP